MKKLITLCFLLVATTLTCSAQDAFNGYDDEIPITYNLDEKGIVARLMNGIEVSSSSKLKYGHRYKLLKVYKAGNEDLVGSPIVCEVTEKRKSNIGGSEGKLTIRPLYLIDKGGIHIPLLPTDIKKRGLNRTNIKFWTSIFIVPIFIPGTRAEILPTEKFELRIL